MKTSCDLVSEHVALGEPLGDLAGHAASCAHCQQVVAMSAALVAAHREIDPGLGFSARMTAGAQHMIVARRRRRVALGLAATVAAGSLGVFVMTRTPEPEPASQIGTATRPPNDHDAPPTDDSDLDTALVHLADVDRSSHVSAPWGRIEKPLRPYRAVLKGLLP